MLGRRTDGCSRIHQRVKLTFAVVGGVVARKTPQLLGCHARNCVTGKSRDLCESRPNGQSILICARKSSKSHIWNWTSAPTTMGRRKDWSNKLTKSQLQVWRGFFASEERVKDLIESHCECTDEEADVKGHSLTLAKLTMCQWDFSRFSSHDGILHQWVRRGESHAMMSRHDDLTDWSEWIEVKPSGFTRGGWGVFAMRDFCKGSHIGFQMAKHHKEATVVKGEAAKLEPVGFDFCIEEGEAPANGCDYVVRSHDGTPRVIRPNGNPSVGPEMGVGMQFLNDATNGLRESGELHKKASEWNNIAATSGGGMVCQTSVKKGSELLLSHSGKAVGIKRALAQDNKAQEQDEGRKMAATPRKKKKKSSVVTPPPVPSGGGIPSVARASSDLVAGRNGAVQAAPEVPTKLAARKSVLRSVPPMVLVPERREPEENEIAHISSDEEDCDDQQEDELVEKQVDKGKK